MPSPGGLRSRGSGTLILRPPAITHALAPSVPQIHPSRVSFLHQASCIFNLSSGPPVWLPERLMSGRRGRGSPTATQGIRGQAGQTQVPACRQHHQHLRRGMSHPQTQGLGPPGQCSPAPGASLASLPSPKGQPCSWAVTFQPFLPLTREQKRNWHPGAESRC